MLVLRLFDRPEILADALEDELEHEEHGGECDEVHMAPSSFEPGFSADT